MLRILASAFLVVALTFALASASEVKGQITRISGKTITITTVPSEGEKAVTKVLTVDKDLMVYRLVKKKRVDVPDGLKAADFQNLGRGGVTATVIVNDDIRRVTEITIGGKRKK